MAFQSLALSPPQRKNNCFVIANVCLAWHLLKYACIWLSFEALSGPICLFISFRHWAGVYQAFFLFTPESKHLSMICFCFSVNLFIFLLFAVCLWVLPFNFRANFSCSTSATCYGCFLKDCSLIMYKVVCIAELSDLCGMHLRFCIFSEVQVLVSLCLWRFPVHRNDFPQSSHSLT